MFNIQFSLRLYFTLISYHNEIRLNPCHLSVCSKRFPSILQLWLMLPVNIMKMQLIFSSNFFSLLLTPKSKRTPTPAPLAQLWLRSWWCCCNIMTPAVCPVSQSSWGSWGDKGEHCEKKMLMFIVRHFLWRRRNDCTSTGFSNAFILCARALPSPGQPFALNEETNYSRL